MGFLEFYALPHCIPSVFVKYLTNPKNSDPFLAEAAGKICFYTFTACLNKSLAKYSQTLIQDHPHLAPI